MSETVDYLRLITRLQEGQPSLARLILEHGYQAPRVIPCPKALRGRPRECYNNAALAVLDYPRRYAYVEGFAKSVIAVEHAWVYDRAQDAIFDPTWRGGMAQEDPREFIGLVFRTPYMREYVYRAKRAALVMEDAKHAYELANDQRRRARALLKGGRTDAQV